mmetsp:Transcript_62514/g.125222  ORF Transcript_62514/g.125222 Transcript_62514/m.125222 type:complete len:249 (-) Transcript_62514:6-752(-)
MASHHTMVCPSPLAKNPPTIAKATMYHMQSRKSGHHVSCSSSLLKMAQHPITNSTLNTAEPTMVPMPTSERLNVPMRLVKSSGAEPPAAIKVAPATSSLTSFLSWITSSAATKYSSHTIAKAQNMYTTPLASTMICRPGTSKVAHVPSSPSSSSSSLFSNRVNAKPASSSVAPKDSPRNTATLTHPRNIAPSPSLNICLVCFMTCLPSTVRKTRRGKPILSLTQKPPRGKLTSRWLSLQKEGKRSLKI